MDDFDDPFFRGCTRPATLLGIPLMPMVMVTLACALAGVWLAYLFTAYALLGAATVYIPLVLEMRAATRKDDQRLRQLWLRVRMRLLHWSSRLRWGAYSYSPHNYQRRS
ncbi:type IV secretion system protein VirB3 [Duganella sp. FT134W]|uniref:Type IV secretion system protein VirB3 n=1 Tax=Duganella margarita TaxID=2692170 RepID=A0A7X4KGX5_9BURK|nr:VirB3 family type IV secretion system protein [Duganella margarita]MYM73956.1 type IV secretion system protein VirB3 [Duganella margarita]